MFDICGFAGNVSTIRWVATMFGEVNPLDTRVIFNQFHDSNYFNVDCICQWSNGSTCLLNASDFYNSVFPVVKLMSLKVDCGVY